MQFVQYIRATCDNEMRGDVIRKQRYTIVAYKQGFTKNKGLSYWFWMTVNMSVGKGFQNPMYTFHTQLSTYDLVTKQSPSEVWIRTISWPGDKTCQEVAGITCQ